jgi:hypothetical protein
VTIKAGGASTDVTVFAAELPLGTVIWSNPGTAGAQVERLVPAVPSPTGVADVFAFQSNYTVQAITSEGATAWTAGLNWSEEAVPDFQGGLVIQDWMEQSIVTLDGVTGQRRGVYQPATGSTLGEMAVHMDGTIFAVQHNYSESGHAPDTVVGIDPITGALKFSVPVATSEMITLGSSMIIAGDGSAYLMYAYRETPGTGDGFLAHIKLLRVNSSGEFSHINVHDWKDALTDEMYVDPHLITNADTGVLASWSNWSGGDYRPHLAVVTGPSVSVVDGPRLPGHEREAIVPVLQAEDGSYVGTVGEGDAAP